MQVHHKPTKILIVGMSGSGKSTYQQRYVMNTSHKYNHYFIFDHKLEFFHRLNIQPCFTSEELLQRITKNERFISYHGSEDFPGDADSAFQFFASWSFEIAKVLQRKCLFVADEVNRFTSSYDMGDNFKLLIEDGRLQGLDFCGTTHAANQISNRLRLQLSEIVALKSRDKRALQFLEESGFDTNEVESLQTGEFITLQLDTMRIVRGKLFENSSRQSEENEKTIEADDHPGEESSEPETENTHPPSQ